MDKQKLSYLAGIIDGEGCINITYLPSRNEYRLKIIIINTNKLLIDWLSNNFGGYVYKVKRPSQKNPKWKLRYEWMIFPRKESLPILNQLKKYCVCKKRQIEIAINFINTIKMKTGNRLSDEALSIRKKSKEELNILNGRGQVQRLNEKTALRRM